jgi:hypothetical protein
MPGTRPGMTITTARITFHHPALAAFISSRAARTALMMF